MAHESDYLTQAELKATLELTGETFADADIDLAIGAASRAVDDIANRRFFADADANQIRHYSPCSKSFLLIDDLVTLTSLKIDTSGDLLFDTTLTENDDFVLEPLNAPDEDRPWRAVRMHPNSSEHLPSFPRGVELTGKFGWSAVPNRVKQATSIIASQMLRRSREAPFGVVAFGVEGGAAMRVATMDPQVKLLLKDFIRDEILIF